MQRTLALPACALALLAVAAGCENGTTAAPLPVYEASVPEAGTFATSRPDTGLDSGQRPVPDATVQTDGAVEAAPDGTVTDTGPTADAMTLVDAAADAPTEDAPADATKG